MPVPSLALVRPAVLTALGPGLPSALHAVLGAGMRAWTIALRWSGRPCCGSPDAGDRMVRTAAGQVSRRTHPEPVTVLTRRAATPA
ncbi:hypothetical protein SSCG_02266 [Streptomyces clavuligerus]|nr:hypothetical protein SSCG_02266 [Streptomyces clavuligerus]